MKIHSHSVILAFMNAQVWSSMGTCLTVPYSIYSRAIVLHVPLYGISIYIQSMCIQFVDKPTVSPAFDIQQTPFATKTPLSRKLGLTSRWCPHRGNTSPWPHFSKAGKEVNINPSLNMASWVGDLPQLDHYVIRLATRPHRVLKKCA